MEIVNCKAIVLKLSDYRESDRMVTLFTLEHGRLSGIARGARRSVKRFGGALELFALLNIQMKFRHALSDLIEADIINIHSGIRGDLGRIAHAAYASDLIATLAPEGMANQRLFRLMSAYLDHLNSHSANNADRRFFEMNLLNILGYRPSLDVCSCCNGTLGADSGSSARISGAYVVCRDCSHSNSEISFEALEFLARSLKTGRFGMLDCSPSSLAEAGTLLDSAIESHLDMPLRSLAFLREIGE